MIGGDFNCTKNDSETRICEFRRKDSEQFSNFIQSQNIWDVQIQNHKYTWFSRAGKCSKLDRMLFSDNWPNKTDWKVIGLPRKSSDHIPLLLLCKKIDWGQKTLRLYDIRYQNTDYKQLIHTSLKEMEKTTQSLHEKLRAIRSQVQKWNKEQNGQFLVVINSLEAQQNKADKVGNIKLAHKIQESLRTKYEEYESILRQKSRILWLKDGDKNTKFFHNTIKRRQWRNNIQGIRYKGMWIKDPRKIKDLFTNHFKNRLKKINSSCGFVTNSLVQKSLTTHIRTGLENSFTEKEILQALLTIDTNKSRGPDGFNGFYLREMWEDLKKDFIGVIQEFHSTGKLPQGLNSTFLVLIPEIEFPVFMQGYHPISLINCTLKILLKLLAQRLKEPITKIISEEQFAFIKGRSISDCILITGEITHSIQTNLIEGIVFKIDFEKAFDSIRWDFLLSVLKMPSFGDRWTM